MSSIFDWKSDCLNTHLKIFYAPKPPAGRKHKYQPVGVYSLEKHVGEFMAYNAIRSFICKGMITDTIKLRNGARIRGYQI